MTPSAAPESSLETLKALTLRRLAMLSRLTAIVLLISRAVNRWLQAASLSGRGWSRALAAFERVRRAVRLIAALEAKLKAALRLIESGVRPRSDVAARASDAGDRAERPERRERADRERFAGLGGDDIDTLAKRPVLDLVERILRDLSIFPAWRSLAEAALSGAETDPAEIAALVDAPVDALLTPRRSVLDLVESRARAPAALHPAPA